MTCLSSSLAILGLLFTAASAHADSIYCWHDSDQQLHCSNRVERVPPGAKVASPPPLGYLSTRRIGPTKRGPSTKSRPPREETRREQRSDCPPQRPTRVGEVMARTIDPKYSRTRRRGPEAFTLFVDGEPVMYRDSSIVQVVGGVDAEHSSASLKDASLAFPSGAAPCMGHPPLEAYSVRSGNSARSRGLCSDFRRAFAQVGITASRDDAVVRSFRSVAENVAEAAAQGYYFDGRENAPMDVRIHNGDESGNELESVRPFVRPEWIRAEQETTRLHHQPVRYAAGRPVHLRPATFDVPAQVGRYRKPARPPVGAPKWNGHLYSRRTVPPTVVVLPEWLPEAHAAQTAEIAAETEAFVDELSVALEEIDRAARDAGCW